MIDSDSDSGLNGIDSGGIKHESDSYMHSYSSVSLLILHRGVTGFYFLEDFS